MELFAIVISVVSLVLTVMHFFWSSIHERKKLTLEAFNILQEQALDILNEYTKSQIKELKRDNTDESFRQVSGSLARIEHFCVGINEDIYDKGVLYKLAGPYFLNNYDKLKPIIVKKQVGFDERFYDNFEKVVTELKKRKKK